MATNRALRRAYTVWAVIYDPLTRFLSNKRQRAIKLLDIRPGQRVLLIGCGTGADFEFLPPVAEYTAIDLTRAMLRKAEQKIGGRRIRLVEMDAMQLGLADASFDRVILHLILAVVPDAGRTLREAERVTKAGGTLTVLDKFWNKPRKPPLPLRLASAMFGGYVTTVDRNFPAILNQTALELVREIPLGFGGLFFVYLLRKSTDAFNMST